VDIKNDVETFVKETDIKLHQSLQILLERMTRREGLRHSSDQFVVASLEEVDRKGVLAFEKLVQHRIAVSRGTRDIPEARFTKSITDK
jgi:hypothetical protein